MGGEEWEEGEDEPYVVLGEVALFNNNIMILIVIIVIMIFIIMVRWSAARTGTTPSPSSARWALLLVAQLYFQPDNKEILHSNGAVALAATIFFIFLLKIKHKHRQNKLVRKKYKE